jgi:DinB superfamily
VQTATASAIQPAISLLERTPLLLETLLRDLSLDLSQWKPAADRWSISEVLAHLADLEEVYADRTRRIVTEDVPGLQRYDQTAAAERGEYSAGTAAEHLARFGRTRRVTVTLLKSLPPASGERTATHSELGTITLAEMLNEWASHDLGHLRQIAELYRAHAFHPYSGPFQKYSNPKP